MLTTFGLDGNYSNKPLSSKKRDFREFLNEMSKRGFYDVLARIDEVGSMHYNDVLKFAFERKLVESRASITIILNGLTDLGLLERTVENTRPMRTTYHVSKKGKIILSLMKEIEGNI